MITTIICICLIIILLVCVLSIVRFPSIIDKFIDSSSDNSSTENSPSDNFIIVTTHINYSESKNKILKDLIDRKWPISNTIIAICSSDKNESYIDPLGYQTMCIENNLYEYSAFLVPHLLHSKQSSKFMLLHDTCTIGANFYTRVSKAFDTFANSNANIYWCSPDGQCNICFFDLVASDVATLKWAHIKSLDKMHAIDIELNPNNKDSIKSDKTLVQLYSPTEQILLEDTTSTYTSGQKRKQLYYPDIDVTKLYVSINHSHEHLHIP